MTQVKILRESTINQLEKEINNFLSDMGCDCIVQDIKFQEHTRAGMSSVSHNFTAMVIYRIAL